MNRGIVLFFFASFATVFVLRVVSAEDLQPGEPLRYAAMYPERWKGKGTSLEMYPWEGKHIIVLTTKKDLDPAIMKIFVDRLDAGWELYGKFIKKPPIKYGLIRGKVPVAMVPDASYTCGLGCGNVANTGVEIAGFYRDHFGGPGDYERVKQNNKVFQHYYFYEFGRNWNSPGRRHSHFGTGFSVFMRYVCLDTLGYVDEDKKIRELINSGEEMLANAVEVPSKPFFGRQLKKGNIADIIAAYPSIMLKLYRENGGNDWLERYFNYLFECPEFEAPKPQILNWVICASCAANKDLTPLFVERWGVPITPTMAAVLAKVDWKAKDLNPYKILLSLPLEEVPQQVAAQHPKFLTEEMRKGNLLGDGSFEKTSDFLWKPAVNKQNGTVVRGETKIVHSGNRAIFVENTKPEDSRLVQTVNVKPKTAYLLSGWVKTEGVKIHDPSGLSGAILNINGTWDRTMTFTGDNDWTYLATVINSGDKTSLEVCVRLGFTSSPATGKVWFDDIVLVEMPQKK